MLKPAIVGVVALNAALLVQDYILGNSPSLVELITRLFLGALVGIGVAKFISRKKRQQ